MMRKLTKWVPALLIAAFLAQAPEAVFAQEERHVVTIEDGKVFIDGKQVKDSDLPESIKRLRMSMSWNFSGDQLLEMNGTVYQVKDGRIVEADENVARDGRLVVFFRDPEDENSTVRVLSRGGVVPFRRSERTYGVVMEDYMNAFQDKAREFQVLQNQISQQSGDQSLVLAEKLQLKAENTARMAMAFPQVEFESYLEGIQEKDQNLYVQLVLEHDMESETHRLAMEARAARNDQQREQIIQQLREKLNEAFQLKQENREKEIQQLAVRLEELRHKLEQRADLQERIIETRLKELLGELNW